MPEHSGTPDPHEAVEPSVQAGPHPDANWPGHASAARGDDSGRRLRSRWFGAPVRPTPDLTGLIPRTVLQAARTAVKGLLGDVKPTHVPGRTERIRTLAEAEVAGAGVTGLLAHSAGVAVWLAVDEAFGKPLLVTVDLLVPDQERHLSRHVKDAPDPLAGLLVDLLDRVVRVLWDNPEIAPVAVRGRVLAQRNPEDIDRRKAPARNRMHLRQGEILVADMTDLGFEDEIARSEELYARFGSPASDPVWRPWAT